MSRSRSVARSSASARDLRPPRTDQAGDLVRDRPPVRGRVGLALLAVGSGGAVTVSCMVGSCSRCTRRRQRVTTPASSSTEVRHGSQFRRDPPTEHGGQPACSATPLPSRFIAMALRKRKSADGDAGRATVHAEEGEERPRRGQDRRCPPSSRWSRRIVLRAARRGARPVRPDEGRAGSGAASSDLRRFSGSGGALHARISRRRRGHRPSCGTARTPPPRTARSPTGPRPRCASSPPRSAPPSGCPPRAARPRTRPPRPSWTSSSSGCSAASASEALTGPEHYAGRSLISPRHSAVVRESRRGAS